MWTMTTHTHSYCKITNNVRGSCPQMLTPIDTHAHRCSREYPPPYHHLATCQCRTEHLSWSTHLKTPAGSIETTYCHFTYGNHQDHWGGSRPSEGTNPGESPMSNSHCHITQSLNSGSDATSSNLSTLNIIIILDQLAQMKNEFSHKATCPIKKHMSH